MAMLVWYFGFMTGNTRYGTERVARSRASVPMVCSAGDPMIMLVWCTILDDRQNEIWQSKGVACSWTSVPIVCGAGAFRAVPMWCTVLDAKPGIDRYGVNKASKWHAHAHLYLLLPFLQSPQPAVPQLEAPSSVAEDL